MHSFWILVRGRGWGAIAIQIEQCSCMHSWRLVKGRGWGAIAIQIEQHSCMHSFWILVRDRGWGAIAIQIEQCSLHSFYKLGHGGQGRGCSTSLLSSSAFVAQFLKIHIKLVFGGLGFGIICYHEYQF